MDESGRGPLAGPVVAAAVIPCGDLDITIIRDSKQLSSDEREKCREIICKTDSSWAIGVVEPEVVDEINILQATFLAMRKAVSGLSVRPDVVLVDGQFTIPGCEIEQKAIIKGDTRELSIAAASIMAKTHRDMLMKRFEEEYPGYGFSRHKGYCTREHLLMLEKLGPCPIHRKSFRPVCNFFGEKSIN